MKTGKKKNRKLKLLKNFQRIFDRIDFSSQIKDTPICKLVNFLGAHLWGVQTFANTVFSRVFRLSMPIKNDLTLKLKCLS
jgi:hypothetical protein